MESSCIYHRLARLKESLERLGVKGLNDAMTGDELDAVTCTFVGRMYLDGSYLTIGDLSEMRMVLPKPPWSTSAARGLSPTVHAYPPDP